jgi:hypothetical protein
MTADGRVATAANWAKGEPCLIKRNAKKNFKNEKLVDTDRPSHGRR